MPDEKTTEEFWLFCTKCKIRYFHARGPKIECQNCGYELAKNFPHEGLWSYCCGCDSFYPSNALQENEAESDCSSCDRTIVRRYLCDNCEVMSLESNVGEARPVEISADGRPLPFCPGCLNPAPTSGILSHDCYSLFITYLTARKECPFCSDAITPLSSVGEKLEEPISPAKTTNRTSHLFESFLQPDATRFNWKSYLPSSRRGWMELIGVVGLVLTTLGTLLTLFPWIPAAFGHQLGRFFRTPLSVSPIECNDHFVLGGQRLRLKVRAQDPANDLKFHWTSSAGALVNHKEHEGQSEVELDTAPIATISVPTEVTIRLIVGDRYGDKVSRQERITVMPRRMANNPPVLKIPPRCNCTLQEVIAGESVSLYALAEDEDKEETLTYEWHSSSPSTQLAPTASSPGSTVILITSGVNPKVVAVPVKISLRVSDGNGGDVMGDITVMVLPKNVAAAKDGIQVNQPPTNSSPKLEAFGADKTTIKAGESVRLWALVSDADGDSPIYYDWRTSAGEIQDKNETAILSTTGITASEVIVVLTISDGHGGRTSQKMFLSVNNSAEATTTPSPSPPQSKVNYDR